MNEKQDAQHHEDQDKFPRRALLTSFAFFIDLVTSFVFFMNCFRRSAAAENGQDCIGSLNNSGREQALFEVRDDRVLDDQLAGGIGQHVLDTVDKLGLENSA